MSKIVTILPNSVCLRQLIEDHGDQWKVCGISVESPDGTQKNIVQQKDLVFHLHEEDDYVTLANRVWDYG